MKPLICGLPCGRLGPPGPKPLQRRLERHGDAVTLEHDKEVRHYGERLLAAGGQAWKLAARERAGRLRLAVTDAKGLPPQALTC